MSYIKSSIHHRQPKSLKGSDDLRNLSLVSEKQHQAWHTLFDNRNPYQIADVINKIWIDPAFKFVVEKKES